MPLQAPSGGTLRLQNMTSGGERRRYSGGPDERATRMLDFQVELSESFYQSR